MGTPTTNQLTGNTNGSIITVDYTTDFQAIGTKLDTLNTRLETINTTLGTINTSLGTLNTSLNTAIGTAGVATAGTLSYSSDAAVGWLAGIGDTLAKMWDQQGKVASAIGQVQLAVSGISSAANESVATQQLALADQISTNEFNKSATKEALERNGLPPPQPRPITAIIQEKVQEATTINATSQATSFVEEKLTNGVNRAANFGADLFASSAAGRYLSKKWEAFTDYLSEPKAVIDAAALEQEKAKAAALAAKRAKV